MTRSGRPRNVFPRPPRALRAGPASAAILLLAIFLAGATSSKAPPPLSTLRLPPGFSISLYARVEGARSMALGDRGTVFVGTRERRGAVRAVVDADGDLVADRVLTLVEDLETPNGVAFRDGALFVAEVSRILRFDGIERRLENPPRAVVVRDDYPKETRHGWKYIAFGPDGWLYVPVGAPCNSCERTEEPRFASITRMKPDGSAVEVFAHGVRNTVGFDWHPVTKDLWFTDNGRDWLGDDLPPDELNRAPRPGLHFGYPYCHGGDLADDTLGERRPCSSFVPPERKLGPHVAALGMKFYRGSMFPPAYRGQVLIAEHGSWNRSRKTGYRVAVVRLEGGKPVSDEPFVEGFLRDEKAWGRPVDILELPDGSILVSDDHAGAIYRITYKKPV